MKNQFAKRLKEIRQEHNLKQTELAQKLHCTQSAIAKWETGLYEPCFDDLLLLSEILNCSTDYLLGKED